MSERPSRVKGNDERASEARAGPLPSSGERNVVARDPHAQLATRRIGVDHIGSGMAPATGGGAVDEYLALQGAAIERLVGCGAEASAAALHMRAEAHRLVVDSGLDPAEARLVVEPIMATAETAIGEVQDELRRVVLHSLRLGRNRLGLA
jgi:hypothetical protein